ncbi:enoyl-CoA hydratase/isomerase family protein [Primorskyibacter marinus]|uniref:enoyl-CoA hydratase/isomerase family protein n=1 Tax=Primorskyibacter marinus TaxID=1977320 RepID=UPI000E30A4B8|nr:enoyl-CoA hydratase/isomerase family protein [Primorskyibacter marinus]
MSNDIHIRREGRAGRITLTRPKALNALTYDMCLNIAKALEDWRGDPNVDLLILDAQGDKAFCAGGDIAEMYRTGTHDDYAYGRQFWHDEYRMNAALAEYPKPVVSLMQGFTMGGGVGLGGHVSHRIICESSRISMPECGIGFVPDVGGSYLLARAPGRLGEYLGLTAARMGPGDAIHAGFADAFVPEDAWPQLIATLEQSGDITAIAAASRPAPESTLAGNQPQIDTLFNAETLAGLVAALRQDGSAFAGETLKAMMRSSPLSMALTLEMLRHLRDGPMTVRDALALEYRVSWRIMEHGDFLEGIRAAIIDKDRRPKWRHSIADVPADEVSKMLAPLGADALNFD